MSGYVKKIALIRGIKSGFSADGGQLSGLVKAESYAGFLKAEMSLINFAPLSEGEYVFGLSDGERCLSFTGEVYEGEAGLNLNRGFACLICFRHGTLTPVAAAVCGGLQSALPVLKQFMEREEGVGELFDDEAIAEVNYYELQADEGGDAVREDEAQKKGEFKPDKNEENSGPVKDAESAVSLRGADNTRAGGGTGGGRVACGDEKTDVVCGAGSFCDSFAGDVGGDNTSQGLAGGDFYERMKDKIEAIFANYPADEQLKSAVEGSRWAMISYGEGKYYSFGVIEVDGVVKYICYAVPAAGEKPSEPPESLKGKTVYVPTATRAYHIMFQDARTGVSIPITYE